jgi:hypothetical protein
VLIERNVFDENRHAIAGKAASSSPRTHARTLRGREGHHPPLVARLAVIVREAMSALSDE